MERRGGKVDGLLSQVLECQVWFGAFGITSTGGLRKDEALIFLITFFESSRLYRRGSETFDMMDDLAALWTSQPNEDV